MEWEHRIPVRGSYALVAYHDENGNGQLDRSKLLGIPSGPYGFPNDARGSFGPPPLQAARFEAPGGSAKITIRVR